MERNERASTHPAFGAALERNRDAYNARFADARRTIRGLSPDDFILVLMVCVQPAVVALSESGANEGEVDRLTRALYEIALDLVGAELAGPGGRYPVLSRMWSELLPEVVGLFGPRPRDTVAALSNAVANISSEEGVDAQLWLDRMLDVTGHCHTVDQLLGAGQVLAWRGGMAHYREGALRALDQLEGPLRQALLGEDETGIEERWGVGGDPELRVVHEVGDYIGLGGGFDSPPEVMQAGGHLFAYDNRACWTIHADRFGATLKRFGASLPEGEPTPARYRVSDRNIEVEGVPGGFALANGTRTWACSDEMAVVTLEFSHRVAIVALAPR